MAEVEISKVRKRFGAVDVLHEIDLKVASGEFVVLVGPSGCGKSTLLRLVAGLEEPSGGRISIGGKVVDDLDPKERGVAMVFQNYALYPHMTVRQNMEYPLKLARLPASEIDARIRDAARMLSLESQLDKKPGQLSGGQKQRVAMGRAMVRRPRVFLFDEPLSNLDAQLRVKMRSEISLLHRRLGSTVIYVTHDQAEAMTLADRIVVLNAGRVEQAGAPLELYHRPQTRFVAAFIGTPQMNIVPISAVSLQNVPDGAESAGFRPEATILGGVDGSLGSGRVVLKELLGRIAHVHVRVGQETIVAELGADKAPELDSEVRFGARPDDLYFFGSGGRRLA